MPVLASIAVIAILEISRIGGAWAFDWTAEKAVRVDALVSHYLRPNRLNGERPPPSLSLAIGVDGNLVLANGYGQASPGTQASEHTVYHIGSLTKQFTAAAMLRLIEEGARAPLTGAPMALETPMLAIFEGVERWNTPEEPTITVRSLLNMTSRRESSTLRARSRWDTRRRSSAPPGS